MCANLMANSDPVAVIGAINIARKPPNRYFMVNCGALWWTEYSLSATAEAARRG
jgi:hypothetical protein